MNYCADKEKVESSSAGTVADEMRADGDPSSPSEESGGNGRRINIDPDNVQNGLGRLVLTLVKLIHELLERQAIRRINSDSLSEDEKLGLALMRQAQEIERLRVEFNLSEEEFNVDLGPLGKLL